MTPKQESEDLMNDLPIRPPQPKGCGFIKAEGQSCVNSALPPKVKTMSFRAELTHEMLDFAKKMLSKYGEFHPFGGVIKKDGDIAHVGAYAGKEFPLGQNLVDIMLDSFKEDARKEKIKAAAIVANVTITPPGKSKIDAIRICLDHKDNYSMQVFFPYILTKDLVVDNPFATKGLRFAFGNYKY
ncbi:MAG: hypothetical protein Q7S22_02715 [Candidatus Micrarchaeota archaeon]|nr:hypothetical protein [Candidatus Micrarchaeota archaeon]